MASPSQQFSYRANYYFGDAPERFNPENDWSWRINRVDGWAITDEEVDDAPGVYLGIDIGEKHTVSIVINEQQLLDMLVAVQSIKKSHKVITKYGFNPDNKASTTLSCDCGGNCGC